jgi:hypothetical protein
VEWHVQHNDGGGEVVSYFATAEMAIEGACRMIDAGHDVFGIGIGPLSDSIGRSEIARIHAIWSGSTLCPHPSPRAARTGKR